MAACIPTESDTAPKNSWHVQCTEPGAVLNDEQIEAAHAATDVGADDGQPERQPVPEGGAIATLLVAAICCCLFALHLYARTF